MIYILFVTVVYFVIQIFVAKKFEQIAIDKGYTPENEHPFAMCFWLGIIGMIYVLALPDLKLLKTQQDLIEALKSTPSGSITAEVKKTRTVTYTDEELPDL